jgi:hypothetical protein
MPYDNLLTYNGANGKVVELNALILGDTLKYQVKVDGVSLHEYNTFQAAFDAYEFYAR